jgi:ribosome maturation factor RimP
MTIENNILKLIEQPIKEIGYEVVRVKISNVAKVKTLQIMIETQNGESITVKDCAKVSGLVSDIFIEDDPIEGEYNLEVSSPGIDRPLTKLEDFSRFANQKAKIKLFTPIENIKNLKCTILGLKDGEILINEKKLGDVTISFNQISDASLDLASDLFGKKEKIKK